MTYDNTKQSCVRQKSPTFAFGKEKDRNFIEQVIKKNNKAVGPASYNPDSAR